MVPQCWRSEKGRKPQYDDPRKNTKKTRKTIHERIPKERLLNCPCVPRVPCGSYCRRSISRVLSLCDHLSTEPVAVFLERPFPESRRATSTSLYSVLLPMGFTKPICYHTAGALLPHHFTVAAEAAVSFLWHFPSGHPARTLSGIAPYEARTFLSELPEGSSQRSPNLLHPHSTLTIILRQIKREKDSFRREQIISRFLADSCVVTTPQ